MAAGGFCKLPDGNVVVALNLSETTTRAADWARPRAPGGSLPGKPEGVPPTPVNVAPVTASGVVGRVPPAGDGSVRVLVLAANRARALTRLRNLGLRAIYLRGNAAPPTPDEITAVLHHPDGLIWRTSPTGGTSTTPELWHPIRALLRRPAARV
ncbi:hypothetical protein ACWD4G_03255 [Streptomyces sp. NPDC002643]